MTTSRVAAVLLAALAISTCAIHPTLADDYPSRPIRLVVPATPGGILDILARLLSERLDHSLGQPVVVENRPAAAGNLGVELVTKAAPDGYSLCLIQVGNVAANPHLYKDLSFDPLRDLAPVATVASSPEIVVAYAGLSANSLAELIALAKREPGKLSYGSAGVGTSTHLGAELFAQMSGTKLLNVPYHGMGPAILDLAAGRVQLAFSGLAPIKSGLESGSLKALAVARSTRLKAAPAIPTADEAGLPGYEFITWFGVEATAGTPPSIVQELNTAINTILETPDIKQRFLELGMEPLAETPAAFSARIQKDYEKYGAMIKAAHIEVNCTTALLRFLFALAAEALKPLGYRRKLRLAHR
jgi:tripartite-type tricarboxylate transporter receptor subunit TctC